MAIYHIALLKDWREAQAEGWYQVSTRGVTIAEQGFLHCSRDADQVARVRGFLYSDCADLMVCELDEQELIKRGFEIRFEPADPRDPDSELFPHVYGGPIPVALMHTPVAKPPAAGR